MRFFTTALAVFVLIATTANGSPMLRMVSSMLRMEETKGKKGKSKTECLLECFCALISDKLIVNKAVP
ncbi:polygalacturonase [Phytophthora cinnamomi]|uniref:polygalacturonase n=1 Tax=Phytophthora cinnamomi TaxID=4785 RepID=UPI00355ACBCF|nr:polygalacturonase [Phytophthora cinnamomi]